MKQHSKVRSIISIFLAIVMTFSQTGVVSLSAEEMPQYEAAVQQTTADNAAVPENTAAIAEMPQMVGEAVPQQDPSAQMAPQDNAAQAVPAEAQQPAQDASVPAQDPTASAQAENPAAEQQTPSDQGQNATPEGAADQGQSNTPEGAADQGQSSTPDGTADQGQSSTPQGAADQNASGSEGQATDQSSQEETSQVMPESEENPAQEDNAGSTAQDTAENENNSTPDAGDSSSTPDGNENVQSNTVNVRFEAEDVRIYVNGMLLSEKAFEFTYGEDLVFTVLPEEGYAIDEVLLNNTPVATTGNENEYRISALTSDAVITVVTSIVDDGLNEEAAMAVGAGRTNLKDFVSPKDQTVTPTPDTNRAGQKMVEAGTRYTVGLRFEESGSALQFDNSETLTMQLPEGFTPDAQNDSLEIDIQGEIIPGNTFVVNPDGSVTVNLNQAYLDKLNSATDEWFKLSFTGTFDNAEGRTGYDFGGGLVLVPAKPDPAEFTISKDGSYDKSTGMAHYKVYVRNPYRETNTDVELTDTLGPALGEAQNITVYSNVPGKTPVYTMGSSSDTGFDLTLSEIVQNEIITIEYDCPIDLTKISGQTSSNAEETANSITGTNSEGYAPDAASKSLQWNVNWTSLEKSAGDVSNEGNIYTVPWTVTVNKDSGASLAGMKIVDTLTSGSNIPTEYDGDITLTVTNQEGTIIRTEQIPAFGDVPWNYDVPSGDDAYCYTFTYETKSDNTDLMVDGKVSNKADLQKADGTSTGYVGNKEVGIPANEGNKLEIAKRASAVSLETIEWTITATVPAGGLTGETTVTDSLPFTYAPGPLTKDTLVDGSVTVTGLLDGEAASIDPVIDPYGGDKVAVTFTANGENGLLPNPEGTKRDIVIKITTKNNSDWLEKASTIDHENKVQFKSGTAQVETSAKALPKEPEETSITKSTTGNGTYENTGLRYFEYTVEIGGVSSFPAVITDTFDTANLELVGGPWTDHSIKVIGKDNSWDNFEGGAVAIAETGSGATLTITEDAAPVKDDGSLYKTYSLKYCLKLKDADALDRLMATSFYDGKVQVVNKASFDGKSSSTTDTIGVKDTEKSIIDGPTEIGKATWLTYQINANPEGLKLSKAGEDVVLTDQFKNLSIDFESIVAEPSAGVSWDVRGDRILFTIPDQTPITITYRARAVGQLGTNVQTRNKAWIKNEDQAQWLDQSVQMAAEGEGGGSYKSIKILKYAGAPDDKDPGDMTQPIPGVTFKLYKDGEQVVDANDKPVTATTNSNGIAVFSSDPALWGSTWEFYSNDAYELIEENTPEGYQPLGHSYTFTIGTNADYDNLVYFDGDTLSIRNNPIGASIELEGTKIFENGNLGEKTFDFKLEDEDGNIVATASSDKDGNIKFEKITYLLLDMGDANSVTHTYKVSEILPEGATSENGYTVDGITYDNSVKTVKVVVSKSADGQSMTAVLSADSDEISFTNTQAEEGKGSLKISKSVTINGEEPEDGADDADGTYYFTVTKKDDESFEPVTAEITISGGAANDVVVPNLDPGTYIVTENESTNGAVLVGTNGLEVVVEADNTENIPTADFINNIEVELTGKLTFTKTVTGGVTQSEAEGALKFTVQNETTGKYLSVDGEGAVSWVSESTELTLGQLSKVDGYKVTGDAENGFLFEVSFEDVAIGKYTITETNSDIDGFEKQSTSVDSGSDTLATGGEITIALQDDYVEETGSLKITKSIAGDTVTEDDLKNLEFTITGPEGFETVVVKLEKFTKNDDGTYTYELNNIPTGDYTVKETQSNIEGYDVEVTYSTEDGKATVTKDVAGEVEITDEYTEIEETGSLKITKSIAGDTVTEDDLKNLEFTITGPEGFETVVVKLEKFTKNDDGTYEYTLDNIPTGDYTVKETQANIEGYDVEVTYSTENGKATVTKDVAGEVAITDKYTAKEEGPTTGQLTFTKTVTGGVTQEEAEGKLTFTIKNDTTGKYLAIASDGTASWTTNVAALTLSQLSKLEGYSVTGNAKNGFLFTVVLKDVEIGKYTITEQNSAIDGYSLNQESSVTSVNTELAAGGGTIINLKDDYAKQTKPSKKVSIKITRHDEVTGEPIVGCKIQVINSEGEVVDEWVTDGKEHTVEGLTPGETYTIHEVSTPEGVKPAKDTKIIVDEDGNVTRDGVKIEGDRIDIVTGEKPEENDDVVTVSFKVNKVDEQGQTLSGAKFSLCEINGNTSTSICTWESGQTPKDLSSVLKPGRTYKLVETQAPAGYCITCECYEIKVAKNGTITVNGTKITSGTLSVVNKKAVTQNVTNVTTNTYVSTTTVGGTTSAGGATAAGTVRTGDDTNVMSFVIAAIAGILVIIGIAVILFRRRKRTM